MTSDWNNYRDVLEQVKNNGYNLEYASVALRDNYEIVMAAVTCTGIDEDEVYDYHDDYEYYLHELRHATFYCGDALKYASPRLCDDYDIVMAAIKNSSHAFKYASPRLRGNFSIAMVACNANGDEMINVSESLKNRYSFLNAIRQPAAFKYLSEKMKDDYNVVKKFVSLYGGNLQYVSARLRNDKDIVKIAIMSGCISPDGEIPYYIPKYFFDDRDIVIEYVSNCRGRIPEKFSDDEEVVANAIAKDPRRYKKISERLRSDKVIAMIAVSNMSYIRNSLPPELVDDPDIIDSIGKKIKPEDIIMTKSALKK